MKFISWMAVLGMVWMTACGPNEDDVRRSTESLIDRMLADNEALIVNSLEAIDDSLHPVAFLNTREEGALRRFRNDDHIARAQILGIVPGADVDSLVALGKLVPLEADTPYWTVRDLDHSRALVTPDVIGMLEELGRRFQAALAERGIPPYRFEITSVLRTAESQADLRRTNVNAAAGVSSHEFGTTLDIIYSAYSAPPSGWIALDTSTSPLLTPFLERLTATAAERIAGRRAGELKAILGRVLAEMQDEGKLFTRLESRQPVYHITVGKRYFSG